MPDATARPPAPAATLSALDAWALDPTVHHLNHGSFGAVPRTTLAQQGALREEMETDPDRWFRALPERVAVARTELARALDIDSEHAALVPNASAGVSVVLNSLRIPAGSQLVVTDHAYGAVAMGVARVAERAGATVRTVHLPLDADDAEVVERIAAALGERTALLVVDQITSATARRLPVDALVARAHAVGAEVLVDGAHAPGLLPDPAGRNGADPADPADPADYWVGNLHKWCGAPRGTALLVARPERAQQLWPLTDSWGAPDPFPHRFDQQGTLDLTGWLAAPHALRTIEEEYGWRRARERMGELVEEARALLAEAVGAPAAEPTGAPAPSMRLVPLPDGVVHDEPSAKALQRRLAAECACETAITAWHGRGFLRLSAHLYNAPAEYAHLAEHLPGLLSATN